MSEEVIISAQGIGKKFRIGATFEHNSLRDHLAEGVKGLFGKGANAEQKRERKERKEFWALKDVNFDIKQGEVVGIIGHNGAGKSTLLKVLSQITDPTEGQIVVKGRVASLLEVGTGFHAELSGRENIFMNGSILGMTKAEIKSKFDEIIDFAGIGKFVDTPVKRYSSGMLVRLGFSVAAHLEPEILVVDEVLAVGDVEFQRKCMGKMEDVSKTGRTILFVSHNMGAIRALCARSILLSDGQVTVDDHTHVAIEGYMKRGILEGENTGIFMRPEDERNGDFWLERVETKPASGAEATSHFSCDSEVRIEVNYGGERPIAGLKGYMTLEKSDGTLVYEGDSVDSESLPFENMPKEGRFTIVIPPRILGPGRYQIYLHFTSRTDPSGPTIDEPGIVGFIELYDNVTRRGDRRRGCLSTRLKWLAE